MDNFSNKPWLIKDSKGNRTFFDIILTCLGDIFYNLHQLSPVYVIDVIEYSSHLCFVQIIIIHSKHPEFRGQNKNNEKANQKTPPQQEYGLKPGLTRND